MDDLNFDKIFGDKLKQGKDFPFTDEKWDKMEKHLDSHLAAQQWRRLWAWLSLPFLALLGLFGFLGWSLHHAQQDIHELRQNVKTLSNELQEERQGKLSAIPPSRKYGDVPSVISAKPIQNDTVYHRVVIRRYDTIFQTVVRRTVYDETTTKQDALSSNTLKTSDVAKNDMAQKENDVLKTALSNKDKAQPTIVNPKSEIVNRDPLSISEKKTENDALKTTPSNTDKVQPTIVNPKPEIVNRDPLSISEKKTESDALKTAPSNNDTAQSKIVIQKSEIVNRAPLSISEKKTESDALKLAPTNNDTAQSKIENQPSETVKQKHPPIIKPIKIRGYELGVTSGLAAIGVEHILRQNGFSGGLRGGLRLGEHLKIVGEAQYLSLSYDVDGITRGLDIPNITPPTPNDVLHEVKVEQPYWQFALGLQYTLGNKRLKPYIGVGLVGQTKFEEKFEYLFINQTTGQDLFVQTRRHEDIFQAPLLRLNVGAEYPIWGKLKGQLEGGYDVKLGHIPQFKPLWQLKAAVLYRF